MRPLMILGGMIGFLIALGMGLIQEASWQTILPRATAAACLAGFVFRWWGRVWIKSLHQVSLKQTAAKTASAEPPVDQTI